MSNLFHQCYMFAELFIKFWLSDGNIFVLIVFEYSPFFFNTFQINVRIPGTLLVTIPESPTVVSNYVHQHHK